MKKSLLILLTITILFSLTIVCATENNDTVAIPHENIQNDNNTIENNNNYIYEEKINTQKSIKTESQKTYYISPNGNENNSGLTKNESIDWDTGIIKAQTENNTILILTEGDYYSEKVIFLIDTPENGTSKFSIEGETGTNVTLHTTLDICYGNNITLSNIKITEAAYCGIYNEANLTIINCTLIGNEGLDNGGGIFNTAGASLTVINSTIQDNFADENGGGIWNLGTAFIYNSRLTGNSVTLEGSAIGNSGTMILKSCAITNNYHEFASISDFPYNEYGSVIFNIGTGNITAENVYISNNDCSYGKLDIIKTDDTATTTFIKRKIIVDVEPINGTIGEEITLTAHVTDENGKNITQGYVIFKINNQTVRSDGNLQGNNTINIKSPIYAYLKKGVATITVNAKSYYKNAKYYTAIYAGTFQYSSQRSKNAKLNISLRKASITVNVTPNSTKQDADIIFTANVKDITPNSNNSYINEGYVFFKHNDKTIRNANGTTLLIPVINGTATYTYHVPAGQRSEIYGTKLLQNYTITAGYTNKIYTTPQQVKINYTVQKSNISINTQLVQINKTSKKLTIKANITDYKGNLVKGVTSINIKINDESIKYTNKTIRTFNIANGTIILENIPIQNKNSYENVTIVVGERQAYLSQRKTIKPTIIT